MQHLKFTKKFKVTKLTYVSICHHGEIVIITQYHLLSKSIIYFVTSWYITILYDWIIIQLGLCHPYVVFTQMFFRYQCFWPYFLLKFTRLDHSPKSWHTLLTVYHFGEVLQKNISRKTFIYWRKKSQNCQILLRS